MSKNVNDDVSNDSPIALRAIFVLNFNESLWRTRDGKIRTNGGLAISQSISRI